MSISNHPVEHEELMAYLDGELSASRAAETASHLEQCPHCQTLAGDLKEISEMLMGWQVEETEREPAKSMSDALQKRDSQKPPSPATMTWRGLINPRNWPKPVWGLAGAGLVLTLVIGVSLTGNRRSTEFATIWPASAKPQATPASPGFDSYATGRARKLSSAGTVTNGNGASINGSLDRNVLATDGTLGRLDDIEANEQEGSENQGNASNVPAINGPMIIRTADLQVTTDAFGKARVAVEEILKRHRGYVGELNVNTPAGSARSLTGTLRVPAGQLDATLSDLKGLGRTEKESQGGEEVTQQYVDLQARLANAKHTEQRLTDMLRDRTGKLSDVLAVEMQISRVRGEIEQMEAQRKTMKNQVDFATLTVTVSEEYKEQLKAVPPSTGTQFRNAAVEGYRSLIDGIISVLLWLLSAGPTLLVWAAILFFPARMLWRRLRPRSARKAQEV